LDISLAGEVVDRVDRFMSRPTFGEKGLESRQMFPSAN